jgi:phage tail-like protein
MAVQRDRPYPGFNFLVDLGSGKTDGPAAGFRECSSIGLELCVVEYRNGNEKENNARKLTGLARAPDVTLRRGIIGSLDLWAWINQVRNGDVGALRTVTISLMDEAHTAVVQAWKLLRARPVRHASGPFDAQSCEVAVEELTLAYERLELE